MNKLLIMGAIPILILSTHLLITLSLLAYFYTTCSILVTYVKRSEEIQRNYLLIKGLMSIYQGITLPTLQIIEW